MPIALDPNQRADVWLPADEATPAETRPTFLAHFLTCRETLLYEQSLKDAHAAKTQAEANAQLNKTLLIAMVGWRNVIDRNGNPIPYDPANFDDVMTAGEKWRLAYEILRRTQLSEDDKKKLEPPLASAGG